MHFAAVAPMYSQAWSGRVRKAKYRLIGCQLCTCLSPLCDPEMDYSRNEKEALRRDRAHAEMRIIGLLERRIKVHVAHLPSRRPPPLLLVR